VGLGSLGRRASINLNKAWESAVDDYLLHHPAPRIEQLENMKKVLPLLSDMNMRNQARLLMAR